MNISISYFAKITLRKSHFDSGRKIIIQEDKNLTYNIHYGLFGLTHVYGMFYYNLFTSISDCGWPQRTDGGSLERPYSLTYDSNITLECFRNYLLVGSEFMHCNGDGTWEGAQECLERTYFPQKTQCYHISSFDKV